MGDGFAAAEHSSSWIICIAQDGRHPINYASLGFGNLFGYNAAESVGLDCSDLVGHRSLVGTDSGLDALSRVAEDAGLQQSDAVRAVELMAGAAAKHIGEPRHSHCRESLLMLNRKKSGELFVCEMASSRKLHPTLKWSYHVGVQADVTNAVSVSTLLQACANGEDDYRALCASWSCESMSMKHESLPAQLDDATRFDEAAERMWREKLANRFTLEGKRHVPSSKDVDLRSKSSLSTTCSHLSSLTTSTQKSGTYQHLGAFMMNPAPEPSAVPVDSCIADRFCDMLEFVDSDDSSGNVEKHEAIDSESLQSAWSSEDDEQRLKRTSLQESAAAFACLAPRLLSSSMFIAEPRNPEFPLLWSSKSFQHLTGLGEVLLGRDLRSLINGMSAESVSSLQIQVEWREFCEACMDGRYYKNSASGVAILDADTPVIPLPEGELAFIQNLRSASGELLNCFISCKQVDLDGTMYVVGLLSKVPEHGYRQNPRSKSAFALQQINVEMDEAIAALAAEFFYSAPMRRQVAFPHIYPMKDFDKNFLSNSLESFESMDLPESARNESSLCSEFLSSDGSSS
eukprot:TRINITY_DN23123_c0_g1_i1.p1 TRINITY_DN23123_c0_g1~~TRINITY_DN23123_c0_g1_i1.p1  ORF type:complete len:571 (-),score=129.48 TRINITY_DN23123_c0_g1_i1:226-1938(-)